MKISINYFPDHRHKRNCWRFNEKNIAAYIADDDLRFYITGKGSELKMTDILDGSINMARASQALTDMKQSDPFANAVLKLNKWEEGAFVRGFNLAHAEDASAMDVVRGYTMMAAKPTFAITAVILPGMQAATLINKGAEIVASQAVKALVGESLGIYMTGGALQSAAETCAVGHENMDGYACAQSLGMLAFAGGSSFSSAGEVGRMIRLSQASGIANTSAQAVVKSMESAGTAGTAQQIVDDAAKAMQAGAKSFAAGPPNPLVQRALSATGALVFGSQAVQVCSEQGISADCLLTSGLAAISGTRSVLSNKMLDPSTVIGKTVLHTDQMVNTGLAVSACGLAWAGEASGEHCSSALMMAGLSLAHSAGEAVKDPTKTNSGITNPWETIEGVSKELIAVKNAKENSVVKINGEDVVITSINRNSVTSQLTDRLGQAVSMGQRQLGQTELAVKKN